MILNFSIGPTLLFGVADFIQNETGYFFRIDINTLDYLLISLIPIFGFLLNSKSKRNSVAEILKANAIITLTCVSSFTIGVLILISRIGSIVENPLIPQSIRVEPFKFYSTFLLAFGIILPFLLIKSEIKNLENNIDEIGKQSE